jgi:hypothetical protein
MGALNARANSCSWDSKLQRLSYAQVRRRADADGGLPTERTVVLANAAADTALLHYIRALEGVRVSPSGPTTSTSSSWMAFSGRGHISSQVMQLRLLPTGRQRLRST